MRGSFQAQNALLISLMSDLFNEEVSVVNQVEQAIDKAGDWFEEVIIGQHHINTKKLTSIKQFQINPMLLPYLSHCVQGEISGESIARALVYPRVFGTSITGSFGANIQTFITDVIAGSFGSVTAGLDIEFTDKIDHRRKYSQIKLGPNTINKDDVKTIHDHFKDIRNRAKLHKMGIQQQDYVVGIMYGTADDLSAHYKKLRDEYDYTLYVGEEFWERLTGDKEFFSKLNGEFRKRITASSLNTLIEKVVDDLSRSKEITDLVKQWS
ncbi:PmeII family type II restriction endonuclease [Candidatus Puniceispirillum sp.]|nr:PmeII family type II restriction endonuclease [Candidatus Puniceispirillum sp.]